MNKDSEKARLSQARVLAEWKRDLKLNEMVTIYLSEMNDSHNRGIYCALVPCAQKKEVLDHIGWDLSCGDRNGMPGAMKYHENGESKVEYLRYGNDAGIEPLVYCRQFNELKEDYNEISEEFRHFHNLYHDKKNDQYIKIDDGGNEDVIVIVEQNRVQIRAKELRQFLAIKEMYLSIQYDFFEYSKHLLDKLGLDEKREDGHDDLLSWNIYHGSDPYSDASYPSTSRLIGKRLIAPLPKSKSGLWGFSDESSQKYVDFAIDIDEVGEEISFTADPSAQANFFGANPDAPNYLTPVYFRKQVLDKYYHQPGKYDVEDSILRCGSLWSMQMDNHHDDKVCVWLGDIGRSLPYEEQLHWRAYNHVLLEDGVSETYFNRQILVQPTDSSRTEHLFIQSYIDLAKVCGESLGWQILLPLNQGDEYHLKCLRIPSTDEQRSFDELVLSLTKILIDSLNEKQLNQFIPLDQQATLKGSIAKLEAALRNCKIEGGENHFSFLRKLQNLRSSSTAHRKGSNYQKIAKEFDLENQSLRNAFDSILRQALGVLDYLLTITRSGLIKGK